MSLMELLVLPIIEGETMKTAIYPGTFDPITIGHLDVVERACKLFDEVYVVILDNGAKSTLFTKEERLALTQASLSHIPNAKAVIHHGLTLDFAHEVQACAMIRGIRQVKDYEYELNNASCNAWIDSNIETILMFSKQEYAFVSSTSIKEFAMFHQTLKGLVSEPVEKALQEKFKDCSK